MKSFKPFFIALAGAAILTSCTSSNISMREPNARVEFERGNFDLSGQVSGEATRSTFLMIDWSRLFNKTSGTVDAPGGSLAASIPVIGSYLTDPTAGYALYEMMQSNPGYDVVFYPQYTTRVSRPVLGIGFIYKKTEVKATARLGKLK